MARATLTPHTPDRDGTTLTSEAADAVNGQQFAWTGADYLLIENTDAAAHTASIVYADTVDGLTVPPKDIPVAAGATVLAGPFPNAYRQDTDGMVYIDWDGDTSVTITLLTVP